MSLRRTFQQLLADRAAVLSAFAAACGMTASAAALDKPNIIVLFADDLGWVDLSTDQTNMGNGSGFYQTPSIDALAAQGLAFSSAYAQQNCAPTRASMLTGQYATRHTVYNVGQLNRANNQGSTLIIPPSVQADDQIDPSDITIAETLQDAGYTTAHFGKFHCSSSGAAISASHGFDFNFGGNNGGSPGRYHAVQDGSSWRFANPQIGPELDPYAGPYTSQYITDNLMPYANGSNPATLLNDAKHVSDAMADAAIDFMNGQIADGNPFYMNVAFHAVHTPIQSRSDLQAKYNGITSTDGRHNSVGYAGLLEGMDHACGRIIDFLEDPNGDGNPDDSIAGETIVVFYSDNGGHEGPTDNAPLRGRKGRLFEGGIRVPMIVRMPDADNPGAYLRGGEVSDRVVHGMDFYPTFTEWAGGSLPIPFFHWVQGESFAAELQGPSDERAPLFYHFPGYLDSRATPTSLVIKTAANGERYKLMYFYESGSYSLFNLTNDLSETTNLIPLAANNDPDDWAAGVELSQELVAWLDTENAQLGTWRATGQPVTAPPLLPTVPPDADSPLRVHLTFDEGSGTTAENSGGSGTSNNGTLVGDAGFAPGVFGTAISLDGNGDIVTCGSSPITGSAPRTMSVWAKTSATGELDVMVALGSNSSNGAKWDFALDNANGGVLELGVAGGRTVGGPPAFNDGQWHLFTSVLPQGLDRLNEVRLFGDGSWLGVQGFDNNRAINTASGIFYVGRRANGSPSTSYFDGEIDDLAIWNEPLSDDEVRALYEVGLDPELGYNAAVFNELREVWLERADEAAIGDLVWTRATGLTDPAGVTIDGAGYRVVLDAAADTGVFAAIPPCNPADIAEPHGVLDIDDVLSFLGAFAAGEPPADLAIPSGVFDIDDVLSFLTAFSTGCP